MKFAVRQQTHIYTKLFVFFRTRNTIWEDVMYLYRELIGAIRIHNACSKLNDSLN